MFSSAGQIIGLIEIEAADAEQLVSSPNSAASDLQADASLGELLARLAQRSTGEVVQTLPVASTFPMHGANRVAGMLAGAEAALSADLAGLEADLAAATAWLRRELTQAASRTVAR